MGAEGRRVVSAGGRQAAGALGRRLAAGSCALAEGDVARGSVRWWQFATAGDGGGSGTPSGRAMAAASVGPSVGAGRWRAASGGRGERRAALAGSGRWGGGDEGPAGVRVVGGKRKCERGGTCRKRSRRGTRPFEGGAPKQGRGRSALKAPPLSRPPPAHEHPGPEGSLSPPWFWAQPLPSAHGEARLLPEPK